MPSHKTTEVNWLGAVGLDIKKREREFELLTLSDVNVVKYLLLNRRNIDKYYNEIQDNYFDNAGIIGDVNQELISLCASLDLILKEINLTNNQKEVLSLLEDGFTYSDIGKMTKKSKQAIRKIFNSIARAIVRENNKRWKKIYQRRVETDEIASNQ